MSHNYTVVYGGIVFGFSTSDERTSAQHWIRENGDDADRFQQAFPDAIALTSGPLGGTTIPG